MRRPPRRDLRALGAKFAFCAPAVAVCVRHWAETTSGRAQGIPGRARAAWRTVARRGRSPATAAKRAVSLPTLGVAVGSQGCGNAL